MTYFNTSKSFYASSNPGQVGSYKQALCRSDDCFSRLTPLVEYSSDFAYRSHKRDSKPGLNIFLNVTDNRRLKSSVTYF